MQCCAQAHACKRYACIAAAVLPWRPVGEHRCGVIKLLVGSCCNLEGIYHLELAAGVCSDTIVGDLVGSHCVSQALAGRQPTNIKLHVASN
jgi:hypothetical protein